MADATSSTRSEACRVARAPAADAAPACGDGPVLRVRQLRKAFMPRLSTGQSLAALLGRYASPSAAAKTVLHDITFDLWAGQALALIGRNGSGKSTLLKIINGSLLPDAGTIECRGRISALIELGAGFDPQASGRQNMAMQGALWGLSRQELADSVQRIIDFSELGPAIDEPVAHYSSGMLLRLAFSIAIAARADLLIVDEALAVGDVRFQQKCIAAVQAHLQRGGALLFVSHDLNSVKQLCDRALVIEDGHIIASGPPAQACQIYLQRLFADGAAGAAASAGSADADASWLQVESITLNGESCRELTVVAGTTLDLCVTLRALRPSDHLCLGVMLHDARGLDIFGTNTALHRQPLRFAHAGKRLRIRWIIDLHLGAGPYTLTLGIHDQHDFTRDVAYWAFDAIVLHVIDAEAHSVGVCRLPCRVQLEPLDATDTLRHDALQPEAPVSPPC